MILILPSSLQKYIIITTMRKVSPSEGMLSQQNIILLQTKISSCRLRRFKMHLEEMQTSWSDFWDWSKGKRMKQCTWRTHKTIFTEIEMLKFVFFVFGIQKWEQKRQQQLEKKERGLAATSHVSILKKLLSWGRGFKSHHPVHFFLL
jgi:hypothetical protein